MNKTSSAIEQKKGIQMKHKVMGNVVKSCRISVILILLFVILFRLFILINPSITGFAVVHGEYSQDLNLTVRQSTEQAVTLQNPGELSSLKISGNVIGKGIVRVYLKVNDNKYLVYDNSLSKNENLITANAVAEELNAAVNETTNLIENITINQTENTTINHAPEWVSETSSFIVDQGSSLTLNLSNYFSDADNDTLSYLASSNENVDVIIDNFVSLMAVIPKPEFSGNSSIILFAGDGKELAAKEIAIVVNPAVITAFEFECAETCFLNNVTANEITIVAELENASLQINSIDYGVFEQVSDNISIPVIEQNITDENIINETIPVLEITNITIRKFHKIEVEKNFKAAENAEFELEFVNETELLEKGKSLNRKNFEKKLNKWAAENETVEASVIYNSNNEKISFDVEIEELREGKFTFNIIKPRQFRAGLYTLEVNFTRSGETTIFSQDFAWGVLAINTHKSIYLSDETAKLGIGVLGDAGNVICNAALLLEITGPSGIKTLLSTENGGISGTPDCKKYGDNALPDYIADYAVNIPGVYIMNLTAETYNGIRNLIDNFTVASQVDFDVERIGPTRIWPPAPYNVGLVIKANKNYNGQVIEKVPSSFEIMPKEGVNVATVGSEKIISFDVNLKKGDIVNLSYTFDAPDESPQFYLLGNAEIGSFSEERYWQIASDQILSDNDASSGINDMNLAEGDSAAVTISYTTDNFGVGSFTWVVELRLTDTNGQRTAINKTCNNGNDFNVTSITFSCPGGQICVENNTAGTGTLTWAKSKTGTVTWNILACTGSSAASPYNITTNETSTQTDQMTWSLNTTANLITVAAPPDNTLPSVLQQYPANNSMNNNGTVVFNCSATDNTNLKNISLWSNFTGTWALNDSWCNVTGTIGSCQWNKTLPSNTYIWGCRAFDLANNSNWTSQNWTLIVDTLSPTFSNALNSSGWQYDNVTMNITISNNAVDGYIFSTNITGTWQNDSWVDITSNPTTYNANTSKNISLASNVGYGWKYYANDTAKNIGESITYNATVKTDIMPNVSLISPADGTTSTLTNFTFKAAGTDDRALVNATLYWNYTGVWLPNETVTVSGTSAQANFTRDNLLTRSISWNIQFCDNAGQCNFSLSNYSLTIRNATTYCAGNYTEAQDWIVSRNITCANETIYVDTNITILNNGSLTLYNVTINFSMFANGSSFINKSPNGGLYIYDLDSDASTQEDGSFITGNSTIAFYDFWAFGNGLNDNLTIRNSKFTDAGYETGSIGLQLYNISNAVISGNNISINTAYRYGLYLQYSTNNNISGNTIVTINIRTHAIYLKSNSHSNTLQFNILESNAGSGGPSDGIFVTDSNNNNISNNTITLLGNGYGIYINSGLNSNISGNTIAVSDSTSDGGIVLNGTSDSNILQSNKITSAGLSGHGIYLLTSSNSTLLVNTITTTNFGYGILLESSSNSTLSGNTITTKNVASNGIYLDSSSNNNVTSNIINTTGTNSNGIYILNNSDNNIFDSNNISDSSRNGIRIEDSTTERNNITNNIILNSKSSGIFINNALTASQLIQGNNISNSQNFSILLNNASNITIIGGFLEYSKIGINVNLSRNVTVTNTTFVLNALWDFYISNNSWVISLNNSFNSSVNVSNVLGDYSNFTVMWYARANVTNSSGIHMNSSSVTSTDVNSNTEWTDTTTNGLTGWFAAIDYIQNGTAAVSYNLHTASASGVSGHLSNSSTYNVSVKNITGTQVDIVLKNANKYCNNSYIQGQATWNITSNLTCANQTIYVDGNITIFNNGSLTLYNVTINFSMFADGSNFINKSPNGGLYIYDLDSNLSTQEDATEIISNNSNFEYDFWVYGNGLNDNLTIRNSKFTDTGYSTKSQGIQLYNVSNAIVSGNNVSDGARYGLYLRYSVNNNLSSNTINTTATLSGFGIYLVSSSNSNTLQSNTITTSGSDSHGIYLGTSSTSNTLQSNVITTRGGMFVVGSAGIYLYSDPNSNNISSNTITTSGTSGVGIYLISSSNNNATSNTINATGTSADGIYIFSNSSSNIINLNNISKSGRDGIRLENSGTSIPERNNITNNIILNATEHGIFANNTLTASQLIQGNNISYSGNFSILLNNASNITIIGGSLEYSKIGLNATLSRNITVTNATFVLNTLWDFYITNNSWVVSLNNSFNKNAVNITNSLGDYSNFTNQYYVDVNVTDSDSLAVSGATVYAYENTTGSWSQEWTDTAAASGFTGKWATIEYTQNGTTVVNYTSNFTASYGSKINSTIKYITSSQQVDVRIPVVTKYCAGNYTEGTDWTVSSNITCANETIPVTGNITILNNASLTLYNISLIFQAFADGSNFINKSPNGGLYIYDLDNNASTQEDATEINTTSSGFEFDFWAFGNGLNDNFTMQNSIIRDAGYATKSQGIQLYNVSNARITGNNISDGARHGLYLLTSTNNNITGNAVNTTVAGIYLVTSANSNTVQSNTVVTTGTSGYGIYLQSSSNSNAVRSNTVTTIGGASFGIYLLTTANSNNITGNTVTTSGSVATAIYLGGGPSSNIIQGNTMTTSGSVNAWGMFLSASSNTVQGNTINTNGSAGYGIGLNGNSNNITGNKINASGPNADGIRLASDTGNNIINLNNITFAGDNGIEVIGASERNNITNNIIQNASKNGIFLNGTLNAYQLLYNNNITYSGINYAAIALYNVSNATIIGGILENNTIGINATLSVNVTIANATFVLNSLWDFYITNNSWITSLNNTFNRSAVNVTGSSVDFSNFTNQYYVDVNVTDGDAVIISGATVYAYENTTGSWSQEWTESTGTDGFTGKWATIEYVQNGTTVVNYTSNFTATKLTKSNSTIKYITSSQQVDVRIPGATKYCNNSYTQGQATWNITSNLTCANETIYVDGNITIFNNGSLTLYNVTINFSMFGDGSNFINKSPNGGLFIYDLDSNSATQEDATEIISNNSDYEYDFWAFGNGNNDNFTMQNSVVRDVGYATKSQGIRLYNMSNVVVTGNNVSGGSLYGLQLLYSTNNNLSNNQINTTALFGYGIYLSKSSNSNTLSSNTIATNGNGGYGIYLWSSTNSNNISTNTITTNGTNGFGIYLTANSNSNTLQSNIITTSGNLGYGIYLESSSNSNNITENTIKTSGSSAVGVYTTSGATSNIIYRNKINATGANADGIYIRDSDNNIINLNNISKSGRDGIRVEWASTGLPERNNITNNIILNATISGIFINNTLTASQSIYNNNISYSGNFSILLKNASNITIIEGFLDYAKIGLNATSSINVTIANATIRGNTLWDFYITNNSWVTSLNNSFNKSAVNVTDVLGDYSNFTNQYYVDVNVTWSNDSAVSGATVFAYENSTGSWVQQWTDTTASTGFTGKWITFEYFQNGTSIINYTSNFTANYTTSENSTIKYITSSQQADVRLQATYCNGNYAKGTDWTVSSNITCANETIPVTGNITILNNASLTLYNISLIFQAFADGSNFINKSPNGGLYIYDLDSDPSTQEDATEINTTSSNFEFDLWVFGNGNNDNFTMQNSKLTDAGYTSTGNKLYNVSNAVVKGNNISGGYSLYTQYSTKNSIADNFINGSAVYFDTSSNSNNITNNTIISLNWYGLLISGSSSNNNVSANRISASYDGVYISGGSGNRIVGNSILDAGSGYSGIYLTATSGNNITRNIINATHNGIYIFGNSDNNLISSNNISSAGRDGIRIGNSGTNLPERNNITNNIILNSTEHGIFINNTKNARQLIQDNNISYSGNASISLNNASNITIIGGFLDYAQIGLNATLSRNVTIANATIRGNTLWDFYITNNSLVTSINNSFNKSINVTDILNDYSNFTNKYYVDVNVTWANDTVASGAAVYAYENSTGSWVQEWTDTTASTGFTGKWATIEYTQNGTTIVNYTSNFTASYGAQANSTIKYITSSQQVDLKINVTPPPATYCAGNYTQGTDWIVSRNITCANETIYVDTNITILNNGSLYLYNATINFSMFTDGSNFINKSPNGGLFVYDLDSNVSTIEDATEIISNNSAYEYDFWVFGNGNNDNFTMRNSIVRDAGYATNSQGIQLYNVSNAIISGNNMSGGALFGLYLQYSTKNNISNNTIATTGNGGNGIHLLSSSNLNTMQGNTITTGGAVTSYGLYFESSSNNTALSNIVQTSGLSSYGIYVVTADYNRILGNNFTTEGPLTDGVILSTSHNSIINSNIITAASSLTRYGIYVLTSNSSSIQNNTIIVSGNAGYGISLYSSSNTNISSNIIATSGSDGYGIYMDTSSNNNVTSNTINATGSGADGIYIFRKSDNNILNLNNITKSGRDGIRIGNLGTDTIPERNNITNNIILNSTEHGIFINNMTAYQFIYNNNISYSGNFSILLLNASNITIIGGSLEYSRVGLNASQSVNVTITNATFVLNTLWDFYITNNSWVTSLNNSFNKTGVNITNSEGDYSNFTNQYYVDVNVTWSNDSAVSGATVFAYENSTGSWVQQWSDTTAATGFTGKWITFEYFQNGTSIINYTSNFTANYTTSENSTIKYITSSQQADVRIVSQVGVATYCSGNYTAGTDWTVSRNITCANETIYIGGNITILNNGSLTLYNVTINFSMIADGSSFINKSPNGGLYIYDLDSNSSTQEDATEIISNDSNYHFDFWVNGNGNKDNFTMQNSIVTDAGYAAKSQGIQVFNASNITIAGNNISGGAQYGLYLQFSANNNITGNTINISTGSGAGVYLFRSSNFNMMQSNTITAEGSGTYGILLSRSNSSAIQSNKITTRGSGADGIYSDSTSNSTIRSNMLNATGANANGIYLFANSDNNAINSNNITQSGKDGIKIEGFRLTIPERNNVTNNIILNSTQNGIFVNNTLTAFQLMQNNNINNSGANYAAIFLKNASNITIISGTIGNNGIGINASQSINVTVANATFIGSALWDFYITNNSWVTSLNNSFNKTGVNITNSEGDYSNFTNQYYVDVNVTWSNDSAVSGATVFAYENSTSSWVQRWTDTTAATGFTGKWATIEYVQNGTTVVNYTSNFTATASGTANSTIKYITSSQQADVRLNATTPPPQAAFNITFLITKTLSPDMVMAASNETINVTTTVKVNRTTNSISFINITDEIPYDFIYENESRIAVLFINWSDAGSNTIDITANVTKTIVDYAGSVNTLLIINISNMSTSLGYYMTENDSIQINYLMNSSMMNANDTRLVYTNVTVKDIASNEAADFKLTNITSSQIVLRGYKKISVDPANPQNATVGIEMQSVGGKLTSILLADYLPNAIVGKSSLIGLNITYYNKTSNSYKTLTEPEDYRLYNPYNSTLPDGQLASVFSYNFSYNFTNWDGTIYENDSLLINYSVVIAGGGSWVLPAIIGGWDPQYQKHIKTEMYTQADVPSFDVITKVLTPKIKPGEDVKALLQMLNVGGPKAKVDVFVTYSMKTMAGELITERSETLAVVEQKEKELLLPTPSTIKPGMYTFETFVTYTGREAVSTDVFEVLGEKGGADLNAQWLMFGIFGLVMVLIIIFVIIRTRKK